MFTVNTQSLVKKCSSLIIFHCIINSAETKLIFWTTRKNAKKKKKKGMEWLFDKIKMIFYSLFQYFLRGNILRSKRRRKTQNLYVLDVRMSMTGVVIFT